MLKYLRTLRVFLLNTIAPYVCLGCNQKITPTTIPPLCATCASQIKLRDAFSCSRCYKRIPGITKNCNCKHSFAVGSALSYSDTRTQSMIRNLKYQKVEIAGAVLASFLGTYLKRSGIDLSKWVVVSVPLSWKRYSKRGFNQSEIILEALKTNEGLPLVIAHKALRRIKDNKPQARTKNYRERRKNMDGVFEVTDPRAVQGKAVIIFDDVFTSGETIRECVRVLRKAGVRRIIALTVAKA